MTRSTVVGALVAVVLAVGAIQVALAASGLGLPASGALASGDGLVVAAPVEVQDVVWADPAYLSGVGYTINRVDVQLEFTSAFNGIIHVRVTATGTAPGLPAGTDESRTLNVGAGTVVTLQTFFNPALPVSGVDDIHVMVCESSPAQPFGRCAP